MKATALLLSARLQLERGNHETMETNGCQGCFLLLSAILSIVVSPKAAFAGTSYSSWVNSSAGSYSFSYRASTTTYSSSAYSGINIYVYNGPAPAGYMGEYTRLYKLGGTLVASAGWNYNSVSQTDLAILSGGQVC